MHNSENNPTDVDLDNMLDSALDDFDEGSEKEETEVEKVTREAKIIVEESQKREINTLQENMEKFIEDAKNPDFQCALEQAFRELTTEDGGKENIKSLLGSLSFPNNVDNNVGKTDVDIGVAKTMQSMAQAAADMEGMEAAKAEQMGEEMMDDMMKEFEKFGEKKDFQGVVDSMMEQLLSKEVMYDPMKQICEKYPEWLAENEEVLPNEDYERYGRQYQYFQEIVAVYETEPDNIVRLTELMQDMQECGQPPSEIVKKLAPGLEFDEEGMPVMPNMGPGMMPMGGMPGFPAGAAFGQEQCTIT